MPKIVVNTTFRDFTGNCNDEMQKKFLHSLQKQTEQDYILVVTIFKEKKVENVVREELKDKCVFIHTEIPEEYRFSLTEAFCNGIQYAKRVNALFLLDCSADIVLQNNFLRTIVRRCPRGGAGISHPNMWCNEVGRPNRGIVPGKLNLGIDARYFSMEFFKNERIQRLCKRYKLFDYGAGFEILLSALAIKYASCCQNVFMESKAIKFENDRECDGKTNPFVERGIMENLPKVREMLVMEGLPSTLINMVEVNKYYSLTRDELKYRTLFCKDYVEHEICKYKH